MQLNDTCVQEKITSLVKQHIPDAKLSAESEGKLVYTLPLERTNRFPGNVCEYHEIKYINNSHKNNVNDNYYNKCLLRAYNVFRYLKHDAKNNITGLFYLQWKILYSNYYTIIPGHFKELC